MDVLLGIWGHTYLYLLIFALVRAQALRPNRRGRKTKNHVLDDPYVYVVAWGPLYIHICIYLKNIYIYIYIY